MSTLTPAERYPGRASTWRLPAATLTFERIPRLMGIVNVTPDSFSDGGQCFDQGRAIDHALQLCVDGADIVDIGGESTRPYADVVSAHEERRRVVPVIQRLRKQTDVPISIDTSKHEVAAAAIEAGAEIINDVSGFRDPLMLTLAAETKAGVCAMHMQGTPQTMQDNPTYADVVEDILEYLAQRKQRLLEAGIAEPSICIDPGVGFGKTHQHNLSLLARCERLHQLQSPILIGHSKKGFIGKVLGDKEADRAAATVGIALALAQRGIQVLRVHNVRQVRQALKLFDAVGGIDGKELQLPE